MFDSGLSEGMRVYGMDWVRRVIVGPRKLLVAFVLVGLLAGTLLVGVSEPGVSRAAPAVPDADADGDPSPVAARGPDRSSAQGRQAPGRTRTGRFDLRMEIPQAPPPEPAWKRARRELVSAPWQYPEGKTPKVVYLTFDDGPYPTWTEQILAVLEKYDARATFFQLGENREAFPGLIEQIRADGHTIGNHSATHASMPSLSLAGMRQEIEHGASSKCFRPPYGATNAAVEQLLAEYGMRTVLWDVDPRDWSQPGVREIAQNILSNVHPGAIVLLHDGGAERAQTVAALSRVLPELQARGYQFHSLPC